MSSDSLFGESCNHKDVLHLCVLGLDAEKFWIHTDYNNNYLLKILLIMCQPYCLMSLEKK